jgi:hypothetical protein
LVKSTFALANEGIPRTRPCRIYAHQQLASGGFWPRQITAKELNEMKRLANHPTAASPPPESETNCPALHQNSRFSLLVFLVFDDFPVTRQSG